MKSKKNFHIIPALFLFMLASFRLCAMVKDDLALLHTELLALSTQEEPEAHLLDFKMEALQSLLMNHKDNIRVPKEHPLALSSTVTLAQLIVAWQDLQVPTFLAKPDAQELLILQSEGYTKEGAQNLLSVLQSKNAQLQKKLQNTTIVGDPMLGGGNVSCGYHALKNILLFTNVIYSTPQEFSAALTALTDLTVTNNLFGTRQQNALLTGRTEPGIWRNFIVTHETSQIMVEGSPVTVENYDYLGRDKERRGNWLTASGIQFLWDTYTVDQAEKDLKALGMAASAFEAIKELYKNKRLITTFVYQPSTPEEYTKLQEAAATFKKSATARLAFVVNENNQHWFALVLNKIKGTTQAIIMDSKNFPRFNDPVVRVIMRDFAEATLPEQREEKSEKDREAERNAILETQRAVIDDYKTATIKMVQALPLSPADKIAHVEKKLTLHDLPPYQKDAFTILAAHQKQTKEALFAQTQQEIIAALSKTTESPQEKLVREAKETLFNALASLQSDIKERPDQKGALINEFFNNDAIKKLIAEAQENLEALKKQLLS